MTAAVPAATPYRGVAMTVAHGFVIASLTGQLTSWIGHHGAYAVFAIMAIDALLPVGGDVAGHKGYGLAMASALIAGLENGALRPTIGKRMPMSEAAKAHEAVLAPGTVGKIVMEV